jgi:hypothetical protein
MKNTDKPAKTKKIRTNIHGIFGTNSKLEEDGAWVEVNGLYGLKIKVRRLRSTVVQKHTEALFLEMFGEGNLRKPGDIGVEQTEELLKRQLAESVLIDWKNLRDEETGDEIPFDLETARELMEIRDFREFVYEQASARDAFRSKAEEEAEGN